jgi:DNA-binding SARP family transcriptional activator/Tfp pilus assembly protein PilF
MAVRMYFGVLGPVLVIRDGTVLPLARPKERALLATLLLNAGRAVTVDELAEGLWDSVPPPSAGVAIRNHVKRLRQSLGDSERTRIRTVANGYRVDVDPDDFDVSRFETLLASARQAGQRDLWPATAQYARQAMALWRGQPLADVMSDPVRAGAVARLDELRLQAAELAADAELRLGRPADLIPELKHLVTEYPLRENLHRLLMLALHESGRAAEALSAYQRVRQLLLDELGTEPGPALRNLFQQILTGAPSAPAGDRADRPDTSVPRQLPAVGRHFVGRAAELAALTELLNSPGGPASVSVIAGTAGVGKTALAVCWAHEAAAFFPDGQLFMNLRGYESGEPVRATDALAEFLRALGVPGRDIPVEESERAARYRSLLAGRRFLIILDNAREVSQVRPLLPGSATCAVMITSRDSLAGLVAREGAARIELDLLPPADAVRLLSEIIGARITAGSAVQLAAACARLPLALRVAAELATARPGVPVKELAAELLSHQRRLDLLDAGGDPLTSVRGVISWSYHRLDSDAARMLRLLGLYPGTDFDVYAAAALAGVSPPAAARLLGRLARAYLIQPCSADSFAMHDLLRAYAAELASASDPGESRTPLSRLLDYCIRAVHNAITTLYPDRLQPGEPGGATAVPALADPLAALAWLDAQRANLVAAVACAVTKGQPAQAIGLARPLFVYLESAGHYPVAVSVCGQALRAAMDIGDRAATAAALSRLGIIAWRQSRFEQAAGQLKQALAVCGETGDEAGQAEVLGNLGLVAFERGDYDEATRYLLQARDLYRRLGRRDSEALALATLGKVAAHRGQYQPGLGNLTQALALFRETGAEDRQAEVLANIGTTVLRMGRHADATDYLQQALAMFRDCGYRHGEAHVLADLGVAAVRQGKCPDAALHLRNALQLFHELGEHAGEAEARNGLGEMFLAEGEATLASGEHATALGIATRIGDKFQLARGHQGLAESLDVTGDRTEAERHWREAFSLYSALGVPEATDVEARLLARPGTVVLHREWLLPSCYRGRPP